jgi:hypothetical protein
VAVREELRAAKATNLRLWADIEDLETKNESFKASFHFIISYCNKFKGSEDRVIINEALGCLKE